MECREEIKYLLLQRKMTLTKLAEEMSKLSGKKISQSFLSQKLGNKTLRYYELEMICKILGYQILFKDKK
ncbi:helix-turn-helix domain-containing protein [bacterium]|nr:helix-turn-helix domain-containing protein [bacterium]